MDWVRWDLWEEKAWFGWNRVDFGVWERGFLCKRIRGWVLFEVIRFGVGKLGRWENRGERLGKLGFEAWRKVCGLGWRFWDGDERGDWGVLEGLVFSVSVKKDYLTGGLARLGFPLVFTIPSSLKNLIKCVFYTVF